MTIFLIFLYFQFTFTLFGYLGINIYELTDTPQGVADTQAT